MKTTKIITTLATLNLILFMSAASFANPYSRLTGDVVKTTVKKEIVAAKGKILEIATLSNSANEFSYLRFDVNKFSSENEKAENLLSPLNYLRFDVNTYIGDKDSEIRELPVASEFEYLRFDVNNFTGNTAGLIDMPVNEFDYLRFDVNRFSVRSSGESDELPAFENASAI